MTEALKPDAWEYAVLSAVRDLQDMYEAQAIMEAREESER